MNKLNRYIKSSYIFKYSNHKQESYINQDSDIYYLSPQTNRKLILKFQIKVPNKNIWYNIYQDPTFLKYFHSQEEYGGQFELCLDKLCKNGMWFYIEKFTQKPIGSSQHKTYIKFTKSKSLPEFDIIKSKVISDNLYRYIDDYLLLQDALEIIPDHKDLMLESKIYGYPNYWYYPMIPEGFHLEDFLMTLNINDGVLTTDEENQKDTVINIYEQDEKFGISYHFKKWN